MSYQSRIHVVAETILSIGWVPRTLSQGIGFVDRSKFSRGSLSAVGTDGVVLEEWFPENVDTPSKNIR
jgi:hypothetical protein